MDTPDILIIGAGVIGCSLARELVRAGRRIVVLDRGRAGGGASSAAAGLLSPTLVAAPAGHLTDLFYQSALLYEDWIRELTAEGGGDVGFRRAGLLEVHADEGEAAQARQDLDMVTRPGRCAEWLDNQELRRHEPALALRQEDPTVGAPRDRGPFKSGNFSQDARMLVAATSSARSTAQTTNPDPRCRHRPRAQVGSEVL